MIPTAIRLQQSANRKKVSDSHSDSSAAEVLEHHINKAPPGEQLPQPPELVSDGLGDSTATVSTDGLTEVARTDLVSDGLGDSTATADGCNSRGPRNGCNSRGP